MGELQGLSEIHDEPLYLDTYSIIFFTGNANLLSLDKQKLYNHYICQEYFAPDSFMNNTNTGLKPTAISYKYNSNVVPSTSSGKTHTLLHFIRSSRSF